MNPDFLDALEALLQARARFLVVGAHALAVHGVPRATGDLDIWISRDEGNAQRVWQALLEFGAPVESLGISAGDFTSPGMVVQVGLPPRRIDFLTDITGVDFESAWGAREVHRVGSLEVPFLGFDELVANKRATGRTKDLADVETLEKSRR